MRQQISGRLREACDEGLPTIVYGADDEWTLTKHFTCV